MSKRELRKLHKDNKGTTMMVCIVLIAILIIFTFALTLAAYTLYSSQNKNVASMRCAEAANTLSIALDDELTDPDAAQYSHLYQYIRYNICQSDEAYWPYYDPSVPNHTSDYAFRYFDMKYNTSKAPDGMDGYPGNIKVCVYWKLPEATSTTDTSQTLFNKMVTNDDRNGVRLYVEITCEAASQSYTVTNVYKLSEPSYESGSANKKYLSEINKDSNPLKDAINPMGFADSKYNWNKNWVWTRVYDEQ